jgi:hypothetical protein
VIDQNDVWLVENRPGAERRFWNSTTGRVSHIFFDTARWKRCVFTARVMLLPSGALSPDLAPPTDAKRVEYVPMHDRRRLVPSPYDPSLVLRLRCCDRERTSWRYTSGTNSWSAIRVERGVWYRLVAYVEEQEGGMHALVVPLGVWRDGDAPDIRRVTIQGLSTAQDWLECNTAEDSIGLWLEAFGAPLLVQGPKFVPVGAEPDMACWSRMAGWRERSEQ